jgi:hypothetical protein
VTSASLCASRSWKRSAAANPCRLQIASREGDASPIKGCSGLAEARSMTGNVVGNCKRCDEPVYEDEAHVMVVDSSLDQSFFHAACGPPVRRKPDLAEDKIRTAREAYHSPNPN